MIETDVLIVGAGPAGLATALTLKRRGFAGRVVVLEKGRKVGSHVLSGAVIDPSGFEGILSKDEIAALPVEAKVRTESFRFVLGSRLSVRIPWVPPLMRARGFPLGSLTRIVLYLADLAVRAGAEIYSGYAVTELVEEDGRVVGARTGAKGVDKRGNRKGNYLPSEEIRARFTVLAEGAAGILTDRLIARKGLAGIRSQSYALGIKELIELPEPEVGSAGTIMHTFGYPVDSRTYGGGFVYRTDDRHVMVGYALGLDFHDPALNAYELFRRFKATSAVAPHIAGGKSVAYGAKLIPEGGYYAVPKTQAPGVLIVGDGAGLLDGLRIKGIHLALESGRAAAEAIVAGDTGAEERYEDLLRSMPGFREVRRVRNVHGGFSYHTLIGVLMAGLAWLTFGRFPFWCVGSRRRDADRTHPKDKVRREEPSAELMTAVYLSGTLHDEDQPSHLRLLDEAKCADCAEMYGSPCLRVCPAGVYRPNGAKVEIAFPNCLHCKSCQDKCPFGNVEWTFPQGGDGPRYAEL